MLRYLWKAFNVAAVRHAAAAALVRGRGLRAWSASFIAPPLALISLGATAMFTGVLASNKRFRTVDRCVASAASSRRKTSMPALLARLDPWSRERHAGKIEAQCAGACRRCWKHARAGQEHITGVWQLKSGCI